MTSIDERDAQLARRHAPILLQKAHPEFMRADFITRVDFAHGWHDVAHNWTAPWERDVHGCFVHTLLAHAYYSVVETRGHYFLLYAFYHPQDWDSVNGHPGTTAATLVQQHVHDLEGCLAIVPKRDHPAEERVEAVVTISHWHFYSFAGWKLIDRQETLPGAYVVRGRNEDIDGPIAATSRFADEPDEPPLRFKLYSESGGHGIKGFRRTWGNERDIVRYRPTLGDAEEPRAEAFLPEDDIRVQTVRYKLISMFDANGLWTHRQNGRVFLESEPGKVRFAKEAGGGLVPGQATPPWAWDDPNDRAMRGDFALHPARLAASYFQGMGEIELDYVRNGYRETAV